MTPVFVLTLGDVIGLLFGGLLMAIWLWFGLKSWWHQARCKHQKGVNETQACDAICRECGKNLGFIGSWREAQTKRNSQ